MIRVLLVDDQDLVRQGLRSIIATAPDLEVVGEASDGDEVLAAVADCGPDVVVMDMRMRRVDGATATAAVRDADGPPVLVLTTFDDDETLGRALRAGAAGFVLKDAPGEEILHAIEHVAAGNSWLDPRLTERVLAQHRAAAPAVASADLSALTERELDVLREVGRGATNAEVAAILHVSEATVKSHLGRTLTKLGLRDRPALIVFAHDQRLL